MHRRPLQTILAAAGLLAGACGDDPGDDRNPATTGGITTVGLSMSSSSSSGAPPASSSSTGDSGSGSAGETTGETTGTTAVDETTGAAHETTGGGTSTTGPDTTTDMTTGEPDPLLQCLMKIELGDECGECACMQCLDELLACQADVGCVEIRECAQDAGCQGFDCIGPCGDVFDLHGGPFGVSGSLAQQIGNCVGVRCPGLCAA